jgi:DNA-directed RNA polymerase specialized sigma24 family protein
MDIETHLLFISDKEQNDADAQGSMAYIYETFRGFVYNVIFKKIHFSLNKEETALIVMSNVFMHVWNNPLDWEFNSSKHKTQKGGYKSYLSVIAKFKFLEELRKSQDSRENEENLIDEEDSEWKWSLLDDEFDFLDEELAKRRNLIDECLSQFPTKKQDIIRMYFLLYEDSKNMNSQDIKMLERMFETTWQNIRQTISRAKRDIKKVIQSKPVNK